MNDTDKENIFSIPLSDNDFYKQYSKPSQLNNERSTIQFRKWTK